MYMYYMYTLLNSTYMYMYKYMGCLSIYMSTCLYTVAYMYIHIYMYCMYIHVLYVYTCTVCIYMYCMYMHVHPISNADCGKGTYMVKPTHVGHLCQYKHASKKTFTAQCTYTTSECSALWGKCECILYTCTVVYTCIHSSRA